MVETQTDTEDNFLKHTTHLHFKLGGEEEKNLATRKTVCVWKLLLQNLFVEHHSYEKNVSNFVANERVTTVAG